MERRGLGGVTQLAGGDQSLLGVADVPNHLEGGTAVLVEVVDFLDGGSLRGTELAGLGLFTLGPGILRGGSLGALRVIDTSPVDHLLVLAGDGGGEELIGGIEGGLGDVLVDAVSEGGHPDATGLGHAHAGGGGGLAHGDGIGPRGGGHGRGGDGFSGEGRGGGQEGGRGEGSLLGDQNLRQRRSASGKAHFLKVTPARLSYAAARQQRRPGRLGQGGAGKSAAVSRAARSVRDGRAGQLRGRWGSTTRWSSER